MPRKCTNIAVPAITLDSWFSLPLKQKEHEEQTRNLSNKWKRFLKPSLCTALQPVWFHQKQKFWWGKAVWNYNYSQLLLLQPGPKRVYELSLTSVSKKWLAVYSVRRMRVESNLKRFLKKLSSAKWSVKHFKQRLVLNSKPEVKES